MKCLHITGKYHPHFRIYLRVFKTMLLCLAMAHGSKDSEVRRTRLQMTKWLLCINVYNPILYYINYTCICSVSSQKSTLQNVWGSLGTVTWENSVGIQSCNWFQKDKNNGMWHAGWWPNLGHDVDELFGKIQKDEKKPSYVWWVTLQTQSLKRRQCHSSYYHRLYCEIMNIG